MSAVDVDIIMRRNALVDFCRDGRAKHIFNAKFGDWLLEHFDIFIQFEKAADKVRERRIAQYSAFVIVNVLRWRADTEGTKFSMTNTFVPDLARLYNLVHNVAFFKVSTRTTTKKLDEHER